MDGAAGGMVFTARGSATNRAGCSSASSLGTFATGYTPPTLDGSRPSAAALVTPQARGDQLLLHYDAREGYTTFLNVANQGATPLAVRITLYGPDLASGLAFAGVALRDLVSLAGAGVEGSAGRLLLEPQSGAARNSLVYFVESLGTFATGYLRPAPTSDFASELAAPRGMCGARGRRFP